MTVNAVGSEPKTDVPNMVSGRSNQEFSYVYEIYIAQEYTILFYLFFTISRDWKTDVRGLMKNTEKRT